MAKRRKSSKRRSVAPRSSRRHQSRREILPPTVYLRAKRGRVSPPIRSVRQGRPRVLTVAQVAAKRRPRRLGGARGENISPRILGLRGARGGSYPLASSLVSSGGRARTRSNRPVQPSVCETRRRRRESIFAVNRQGKQNHGAYRRTASSLVRCK